MKTIKLYIFLTGIFFTTQISFAQKTEFYTDFQNEIQVAKELIKQEKFNAAYRQFEKIQAKVEGESELYSEAEYFKAYSLLKSEQVNADRAMNEFLEQFPESPYQNKGLFNLGVFQFDKQRYTLAIRTLDQVDESGLDEKEKVLLHYQLGYANMVNENLDKAVAEFFEIKDANNLYSKPASYYWAHINYLNGNYESALNGLRKLNGDPTYSPVIPLYVSHIYYKQGKYDEIVSYTPGIIGDVDDEQKSELSKIVGDSYFHLNKFEEAIPYLEEYHKSGGLKTNEDNYLLGYCYYHTENYSEAIPYLQKATKGTDELTQNAYYHLADCYIQTGDKEKAKVAFASASEMDFNDKIKEDALFNFAKITYELSYSPFSETIKAFDKYISLYPNSERNNSAYQYLVEVYMVTRNYEDAINSIEKIENKNAAINKAYQRVTFFRGLELFNDQAYNQAIKYFDKSLGNNSGDREQNARAQYWKAEALYRVSDYNSAISQYDKFLITPGAFSLSEYNDAQYNMAYAYFKLENYQAAGSSFRKFLNANQDKRTEKVADAFSRLGDIYFLNREYTEAVNNYERAYNMRLYGSDYALFQLAFCEGLQRNYQNKVTNLRNLLNDYPNSEYLDDALYELGRAYERIGQNNEALNLYNDIKNNYSQSPYYKKALIQLGLINYNNGNLQESMKFYKEVAENYPNTEEAEAALTGIRNNYIELNDVDAFLNYTRQLGRGTVSASEQDALTYQAAEKQFMANGKDATNQLKQYLSDFPYGANVLNAHFYLAESLYRNGDYSESLIHYDYVANQPENLFSEPAVAKAAELTLNAKDYQKALSFFKKLETLSTSPYNNLNASSGLMRCNFELQNYKDAINAASKVQDHERSSNQLIREADYIFAKSNYILGNSDQALTGFRKLTGDTKSTQGAEAKYIVSELLFKKGQLQQSEEEIMDFISMGTPHQFWLGKSFILLSDIYQAQDDDFQAKYTLKSVIENYGNQNDGIIKEASEKLSAIEAKENAEQQEAKSNPVELKIDN